MLTKNKKFFLITIILIVFTILVLLISYFASKSKTRTLPVETIKGQFAVDPENIKALVGFSDLYFIGQVVKEVKIDYRDKVQSENPKINGGMPYTYYEIKVLKNIKGNLPTDKTIQIVKFGGKDEDRKTTIVFENDTMPVTGKTYAMIACVQDNGEILLSGPNSNVELKNYKKDSKIVRELEDNYKNEIKYKRERASLKF